MAEPKLLSAKQVAAHHSIKDCWIVVDGQVWDITDFTPEHPGGAGIILRYAGRDATEPYSEVHGPALILKSLSTSKLMGTLDTSTIDESWSKPPPSENPTVQLSHERPPLSTLLSSHDFETVARKTLSPKTWAFYSSAATDLITAKANKSFFDQIWFRPRVLNDVRKVNTECHFQALRSSLPLFVSPAAMAKMVHKSGERGIAGACARKGIIQCVSTNASYSIEEIVSAAPNHPFFFQLYVNKNRSSTESLLQHVYSLGIRSIFVTVDAPAPGKREADERVRADETLNTPMSGATAVNDKHGGGLGRIMGSYIDDRLNWNDLGWLRRIWKGKIVIKGIMGAADATRAAKEGMDGIVLSNHGGRNLDTSPPSILVLLELQRCCPEVFDQLEVFVDGGIRRGTDILKALCLGATAVSIGRSFLYALNYGEEGVEHLIDIMRDEVETAMRLLGLTDLSQVHPGLVNTLGLDHLVPSTPDHPYAKWSRTSRL